MSTTLREELVRCADQAGAPTLDVEALIDLGERRLRRRQLGTALGSAAAVLIVIALVIGGASLIGPSRSTGPIDKPSPSPSPREAVARPIVYGDGFHGRVIQYGKQVIPTGRSFLHMTVTDDGLLYVKGKRFMAHRVVVEENQVWFSDGTGVQQIGANACGGHLFEREVFSGNAGSLVVWRDCPARGREALVVYDTSADATGERRGVVARVDSLCDNTGAGWAQFCDLRGLVGDHLYWTRTVHVRHRHGPGTGPEWRTSLLRYDVSSGHRTRVSEGQYGIDRRAVPRGLVVGDSWGSGTATDGIGQAFRVFHGRLIPQGDQLDGSKPTETSAFVTGTGRPLHLRLPAAYAERFGSSATDHALRLFEWLDDDTVALGVGINGWDEPGLNGDILRCTVSTGRCEVAVHGGSVDVRIVPNLGLPG